MRRFLIQRLLAFVPTLVGISIVVFLVMRLIPGDTISAMIGTQYKLTEAQAAALRAYFGLDKPLPEQYLIWLTAALRGDFGYSVRSGQPVLPEILNRFPLTLELALLAMMIALAIGLPLGVVSAVKRDSLIDLSGRLFALIGLALPNFWLGTLLILVLSVVFQTLPNSGDYTDLLEDPLANLKQMLFPAITLGFAFSASILRATRSSLLEELQQDYARTARGKGLRERRVIAGHCLKNALIPIITIAGVEMGYLFGGAVIVEEIFTLPGIGRLLLNAISQRDYAVVQGTIMFIAFNFVLINLLADLAYAFVNPRIRYD
ncbi:MAG: ABC transporter permease [Chloroflexi bacterium]|nr:ABC transporter permease [Chloroflexota bacterium]